MQILIKLVLAGIWMGLIPAVSGVIWVKRKKDYTFGESFLAGIIFMFALAEILILPAIYRKLSLHFVTTVFTVIMGAAAVYGLWELRKDAKAHIRRIRRELPQVSFWMWIAALFGMATKYAEGVLAIKYRTIDESGHVLGGPFYYIENGMGKNWRWLGKIFAFFGAGVGLLGIGTFTQVNGITAAAGNFFDQNREHVINLFGNDYSIAVVVTGILLTICVALVVLGGIQRIASVSSVIVPFMAVFYIIACIAILVLNAARIPAAFAEIIQSAFGLRAAAGGALGAVLIAMQKGIARGIFSNEAGLGSAPIAAAAAQTNEPARQGLVTMTGTFIDTIIVCTMTGLCIVLTGSHTAGLEGVAVTTRAFQMGLPVPAQFSAFLLMMCLIFFAFTTIIGWNYYGERCLEYLSNGSHGAVMAYRFLYILAIFIGPFMTVEAVWTIADIFNALMALPNLIALLALSGVVVAETKDYWTRVLGDKISK